MKYIPNVISMFRKRKHEFYDINNSSFIKIDNATDNAININYQQ